MERSFISKVISMIGIPMLIIGAGAIVCAVIMTIFNLNERKLMNAYEIPTEPLIKLFTAKKSVESLTNDVERAVYSGEIPVETNTHFEMFETAMSEYEGDIISVQVKECYDKTMNIYFSYVKPLAVSLIENCELGNATNDDLAELIKEIDSLNYELDSLYDYYFEIREIGYEQSIERRQDMLVILTMIMTITIIISVLLATKQLIKAFHKPKREE